MSDDRSPAYRLLFVSGSPKSGTTWLQNILDAHPAIACAGEGHFIELIVNPMLKMLRAYDGKLKMVDERVYQGKAPYQPFADSEVISIVRDLVGRLMLRQKPAPGILWLGDKTPRYTDGLRELRALFPSARFIHIVRDPRDVAVSIQFHGKRIGMDDALVPGSANYYKLVDTSSKSWAAQNERVEAFVGAHSAHRAIVHSIRYERLLNEFETVAASLFGFLGVEASAARIAAIKQATGFEQLSGGRKSGEEDPTSFFRKGVAGDWEERLDADALKIVEANCGPLMRTYGYAEDKGKPAP